MSGLPRSHQCPFSRRSPQPGAVWPAPAGGAVYLVEQQLVPYGRVHEVFSDLFGAELSVGTLVEWVSRAARVLEPVEARIKAALLKAPVLHSDETGMGQIGILLPQR